MTDPIWTISDICAATGAQTAGSPTNDPVSGISIDTRTLVSGDLFVPLSANRDGHAFVDAAFEAGAACAFVRNDFQTTRSDAHLLRVDEPLRALQDLARAARARLKDDTAVVAVTGSVGKTGTKEMLRAAFSVFGKTHAAVKSFNNHWGVPLTLARTPRDCAAAIYEIGMNHAGEISPLTTMVQPGIAIITTVEAVHLEFFNSVDDIARAKAEIFDGLTAGGVAILNRDNRYFELLKSLAKERGADVVSFGQHRQSDVRLTSFASVESGTAVSADVAGSEVAFRLQVPGAHQAHNALAVLASLHVADCDVAQGAVALSALRPSAGRGAQIVIDVPDGKICVIDESYNANPASMRAALSVLAEVPKTRTARRIAVLGDMLELGPESPALHAGLAKDPSLTEIDRVFVCGPHMRALYKALPEAQRGGWAEDAKLLARHVVNHLEAGDTVMIKGSLGSGMAHVVEEIRRSFQR